MSKPIIEGDTAYTERGAMVEVVRVIKLVGFVVRNVYHECDFYGDEIERLSPVGEPYFVEGLAKEPPQQRYHEDIGRLRAEIEQLEEKRRSVSQAISSLSQKQRKVEHLQQSIAKEHETLSDLLFFMREGVPLIVTWDHQMVPKIITKDDREAWCGNEDKRKLKLLAFTGKKWKISHYSDGSGVWRNGMPCRDIETAREVCKQVLQKALCDGSFIPGESFISACKEYAVSLPGEILSSFHERRLRLASKSVAEKEARLQTVSQELEASKKRLQALSRESS